MNGEAPRPPADLVAPQWTAESLNHNPLNGATGGIWRVGRAGQNAILKIATPPGRDGVPAHWAPSTDQGHYSTGSRVRATRHGHSVAQARQSQIGRCGRCSRGASAVIESRCPGPGALARG
ncbi:hypothetical protein H4W31_003099 [Plantactinospora soyae]|uniref:Uncharacterized protein n=1 Tax=Plantactinospora soyae TaxID=1544732 RepID=A0A927M6E8_9ACTN|nr:hypothetical protein [Plantactinospora soyae]